MLDKKGLVYLKEKRRVLYWISFFKFLFLFSNGFSSFLSRLSYFHSSAWFSSVFIFFIYPFLLDSLFFFVSFLRISYGWLMMSTNYKSTRWWERPGWWRTLGSPRSIQLAGNMAPFDRRTRRGTGLLNTFWFGPVYTQHMGPLLSYFSMAVYSLQRKEGNTWLYACD